MYIVDPTETADNSVYESVNNLLGTTETNAEIDANPLFQNAELYIIGKIPDATERTYAQRTKVLLALGMIAASYMLSGGAPNAVGGQTVKSETIGLLRTEYATSQTQGSQSVANRSQFLLDSGNSILNSILGTSDTGDTDVSVSLTASKL